VLFWVLKVLYIEGGNLFNHHQCVAAILRLNAHHTPAYLVDRRQ